MLKLQCNSQYRHTFIYLFPSVNLQYMWGNDIVSWSHETWRQHKATNSYLHSSKTGDATNSNVFSAYKESLNMKICLTLSHVLLHEW